jgi:hypothetical protein
METNMWTPWGDPPPETLDAATPFVEPDIIDATPPEQVSQIVSDLQSEGLVGLVERTEILRRYPEWCWMHGWMPLAENHLFEALAKTVARKRPFHRGQRVTCYVIPSAPRAVAAQTAHKAKLSAIVNARPLGRERQRRAA